MTSRRSSSSTLSPRNSSTDPRRSTGACARKKRQCTTTRNMTSYALSRHEDVAAEFKDYET